MSPSDNQRKVKCDKCHGEGYGGCMCYVPEESDNPTPRAPDESELEAAARAILSKDRGITIDDFYANDKQYSRELDLIKAGAKYGEAKGREIGWNEAIEIVRRMGDLQVSPEWVLAALEASAMKCGIKIGSE